MSTRVLRIVAAFLIAIPFLVGTGGTILAQAPAPNVGGGSRETQQDNHAQPYQNEDGVWMAPENGVATERRQSIKPLATGGPDDYGYTWNDSVALSWIDAKTGGSIAAMSGYSTGQRTGPIGLPFAFKYYENTYSSIFIAGSGYLGFVDSGNWPWQPHIPSAALPNNIIAPYATPLNLASSGSTNRIYYKSGGSTPNRYFVVEWYQVKFEDDTYNFEVILYENGDILYQFLQMTYVGGWACGATGIEDSTGTIGISYGDYCVKALSNKAIRFYRPAPSARVKFTPLAQGKFIRPDERVTFPMTIRNLGEFGADSYDLSILSTWPVTVFASDGVTPLTDTDADGNIEIGSVPQSASVTVYLAIHAPLLGNVGDSSLTILNLYSSLGASSGPAIYKVAIPASFTQAFEDYADYAMSLSLIQPGKEDVRKATPNNAYGDYMSIAAKSDGYVYIWDLYSYFGTSSREHIEYALLDKNGNVTRSPSLLTDNNTPPYYAYDYYPAVDVAPNGRIGVTWMRELWNTSTGKSLFNVYFTILDSSGSMLFTPVNLTNNSVWGSYSDLNVPRFYRNQIAATSDNRFMIAWEGEHQESAGYVEDLYYLVRDSNNVSIKGLIKYTNDTPGGDQYYESPTLTRLGNNQVFMAWTQYENSNYSNAYAVFNSSGNEVHAKTPLTLYAWGVDAVQLSNGRILIAGRQWGVDGPLMAYSMLDGTSFTEVASNVQLNNPFNMLKGDDYVSVTTDDAGHGILTWMDYDSNSRKNLYYALVDGNGSTLTEPMILRTSQAADPYIQTSYFGYGNTTNKLATPTSQDTDLRVNAPLLTGGQQGGMALIPVWVGNYGAAKATSVVLTATWDNNLTYVGADPAPTSVVGNTATWNLADLAYQGSGKITLTVSLPSTVIGTLYPITWYASSTGPEAYPADNTATTNVMESVQVYLPLTKK